jgi:hypothetical protein
MNIAMSSSLDACENDSAASAAAMAASTSAGREYLVEALSTIHVCKDKVVHLQEGSAFLSRLHASSKQGMPRAQRCPSHRNARRR